MNHPRRIEGLHLSGRMESCHRQPGAGSQRATAELVIHAAQAGGDLVDLIDGADLHAWRVPVTLDTSPTGRASSHTHRGQELASRHVIRLGDRTDGARSDRCSLRAGDTIVGGWSRRIVAAAHRIEFGGGTADLASLVVGNKCGWARPRGCSNSRVVCSWAKRCCAASVGEMRQHCAGLFGGTVVRFGWAMALSSSLGRRPGSVVWLRVGVL